VQGLLVREPASRLTANQALEHPWIKDQRSAPSKSLNGSVVRMNTSAFQLLEPAGWLPVCAFLCAVLCCVVLCRVVLCKAALTTLNQSCIYHWCADSQNRTLYRELLRAVCKRLQGNTRVA